MSERRGAPQDRPDEDSGFSLDTLLGLFVVAVLIVVVLVVGYMVVGALFIASSLGGD